MTAIRGTGRRRSHPRRKTDLRARFSGPKQEGTQGGWRLDHAADGTSRPASAQHVGVVDAVAASQRGGHQRQHFVARVRPPGRISEVNVVVDEFTQSQVLGEGDRKEQPSIGHQAVVVEGDLDAVGVVIW